jgi:hypothetical protein
MSPHSMTFEEYWATTELSKTSPEILAEAFKEVARAAWEAAVKATWENAASIV